MALVTLVVKPDRYTDEATVEFRWSVQPADALIYYQLVPVDTGWQGPIAIARLRYRELPEGAYVFKLAPRLEDGGPGVPVEWSFYVVLAEEIPDTAPTQRSLPPVASVSAAIDTKPRGAMRSQDYNKFITNVIDDMTAISQTQATTRAYIGESRNAWHLETLALQQAVDHLEYLMADVLPELAASASVSRAKYTLPIDMGNVLPGVPSELSAWFGDVVDATVDTVSHAMYPALRSAPVERLAYRHPVSSRVQPASDTKGKVIFTPAGHDVGVNDVASGVDYDITTAWVANVSQPIAWNGSQEASFVVSVPNWYGGNTLANAVCIVPHPTLGVDILAIEYREGSGELDMGSELDWTLLPSYPTSGGAPAVIERPCALSYRFRPVNIGALRVRMRARHYVDAGTYKRFTMGLKNIGIRQERYVAKSSYAWFTLPIPYISGTMYRILKCESHISNLSELTMDLAPVTFSFFRRNAMGNYDPIAIGERMAPVAAGEVVIAVMAIKPDPNAGAAPLIDRIDATFMRA